MGGASACNAEPVARTPIMAHDNRFLACFLATQCIHEANKIGSRLIQEIEAGPPDGAADRAGAWLSGIRKALDSMQRRAA